uniref:Uncharacterized protein n=1 Tax=Plectus sambesii TaxID=2011161 RepID=A0A914XR74_9BILA
MMAEQMTIVMTAAMSVRAHLVVLAGSDSRKLLLVRGTGVTDRLNIIEEPTEGDGFASSIVIEPYGRVVVAPIVNGSRSKVGLDLADTDISSCLQLLSSNEMQVSINSSSSSSTLHDVIFLFVSFDHRLRVSCSKRPQSKRDCDPLTNSSKGAIIGERTTAVDIRVKGGLLK